MQGKRRPIPTAIISRKEAVAKGLKYYFTGKPCKNGHVSEQLVKGGCVQCKRESVINLPIEERRAKYRRAKEREMELRALHEKRIAEIEAKAAAWQLEWDASKKRWAEERAARKLAKKMGLAPFI